MIEWIDSNSGLQQMCQQLSQEPKLAVDTEFIRTDTFYPKIALIQISDGDQCWLIDSHLVKARGLRRGKRW